MRRIYVHEEIYDEFLEKYTAATDIWKANDQWNAHSMRGPQISKQEFEKILRYIELGKKEGANLHKGGHKIDR